MAQSKSPTRLRRTAHRFATTHWSVVVAAGKRDSTRARAALEVLCRDYWYPSYAFVRRLGHTPHDSEDMIQAFFAQCLAKNYFAAADASKGRFRSFLLTALKRFMANEWHKARTRKRGAGQSPLHLDALTAEQRYALEPADRLSADRLFERRWAMTLLENVLSRLEIEQVNAGRKDSFAVLRDFLTGQARAPLVAAANTLNMTEGALKVAIYRLRRRYRELLEQEIANTVVSPDEIDEERRYLLRALASE